MMAEYGIQISAKDHLGRITVISGKDAQEFKGTLTEIVGSADAEHIINAMALALVGSEAVSALAPLSPKSSASQVQSGGGAPAQTDGPQVATDKYGNTWTYGLPNAPQTSNRGAFVLKSWVDKSGKPRKKWFDPAAGPLWSGAPVPKDFFEEGPWYNG